MRQWLAGHLDPAETSRLEHSLELDLCAEDLLHAAHVLVSAEHVDVAIEEAAAHFDAAARLDHLVAERTTLPALAGSGCLLLSLARGHGRSV